MNDPATNETDHAVAECCHEVDECVRRNPTSAILCAVGAGLLLGLLVRALRPAPTPQDRVVRLLEDIGDRLRELSRPVLRRASALASEGIDAAKHGEAQVGSLLGDASRRVRRLFR